MRIVLELHPALRFCGRYEAVRLLGQMVLRASEMNKPASVGHGLPQRARVVLRGAAVHTWIDRVFDRSVTFTSWDSPI